MDEFKKSTSHRRIYHLKLTFKGIRLGFLEKNIKNNKWFTDNSLGKSPGVDCD
jgi:hypothetical protein